MRSSAPRRRYRPQPSTVILALSSRKWNQWFHILELGAASVQEFAGYAGSTNYPLREKQKPAVQAPTGEGVIQRVNRDALPETEEESISYERARVLSRAPIQTIG